MTKLSTDTIKKLIGEWLNTPSNGDYVIRQFVGHVDSKNHIQYLIECAQSLNLPPSSTFDDVRTHLLKIFSDSSGWRREQKSRLGQEGWEDYFYDSTKPDAQYQMPGRVIDSFNVCDLGDEFPDVIKTVKFDDFPKCWHRVFIPKNEFLQDTFRLEVVSTPDDTQILGWTIIQD